MINFCALFTYKNVHVKTFQLQRLLYRRLYKIKCLPAFKHRR